MATHSSRLSRQHRHSSLHAHLHTLLPAPWIPAPLIPTSRASQRPHLLRLPQTAYSPSSPLETVPWLHTAICSGHSEASFPRPGLSPRPYPALRVFPRPPCRRAPFTTGHGGGRKQERQYSGHLKARRGPQFRVHCSPHPPHGSSGHNGLRQEPALLLGSTS